MDFGDLEGYEDLDPENMMEDPESFSLRDNDIPRTPAEKKSRPAFFSRSVKAAERAALRTQVDEADSFLIHEDGQVMNTTHSHVLGTFGRRTRIKGNAPDVRPYKEVTAELDSDDELMMTMRERGFTDVQIAERLAQDGRSKYDRKTISTRINRIKQTQATHTDYLLKEGFKEWTEEDDNILLQAYQYANIEVNYEIERARAWRFRKVSEYMRRLDKDKIFSEDACRERFVGLMQGTAKIPPELDDNPEQRRAEMEAYRAERERQRVIENAAKEEKAAMERAVKEEARLRQAHKAEQAAISREKKQSKKAERAQKRKEKAERKLQGATRLKELKVQRAEGLRQQKEQEKEEALKKNRERNNNTPLALTRVVDLRTVTADTPDPRTFLSFEDLQHLCRARSLSDDGECKEELVRRLRDSDNQLYRTGAELKKVCRAKGLNIAGTNTILKYQLALAEAKTYKSFSEDATGTDTMML